MGLKYCTPLNCNFLQHCPDPIPSQSILFDETHLLAVDKSYILPDFSGKEADLVYRLKLDEQEVIFYVLMELQSTVDFQMPYRLLLYQVEIWRDYMKNIGKEAALAKGFSNARYHSNGFV
jgi:predicted transposase YdaD